MPTHNAEYSYSEHILIACERACPASRAGTRQNYRFNHSIHGNLILIDPIFILLAYTIRFTF